MCVFKSKFVHKRTCNLAVYWKIFSKWLNFNAKKRVAQPLLIERQKIKLMPHIAIPIPAGPGKQDIEIEMTINGERQQLHYRVELFYWSDCNIPTINRVECIRGILNEYDRDWMLYFIGEPTDDFVPITFVKKEDWAKKRKLLVGG